MAKNKEKKPKKEKTNKPIKNRMSLKLVPHGSGTDKTMNVHFVVLSVLVLAGLLFIGGAIYVVFGYSKNILDITQLQRYEKLSEEQKEKIAEMEKGVASLEKDADEISDMQLELADSHRLRHIQEPGDLLKHRYDVYDKEASEIELADFDKLETRLSAIKASMRQVGTSFESGDDEIEYTPTIAPARGWIIRDFGETETPVSGDGVTMMHRGVDIGAERGTPIVATAGGVVSYAGLREHFGLTVEINHGNGYETVYAHNMRNSVRDGDSVRRGDVIGYMGSTGKTTSTHVHYEVHKDGNPINPRYFILDEPELPISVGLSDL